MSFGPLRPARIDFSDPAAPMAPEFGDVYHARAGGLAQARHVFLQGNGLPGRWAGRSRFVILETGFGLGHNFLATWAAWRDDPHRCDTLWFVAIEKHPPCLSDLACAHAGSPLGDLARQLQAQWPVATPDLHPVDFEQGRVRLILAWADIALVLPELMAGVDAFFLDGFAPQRNPAMWEARVLRGLGRLAMPGATVATWSVASAVRNGLLGAGFEVSKAPGFADKREMTVGRFAPHHVPMPPPGRQAMTATQAVIVGAGLAGAAAARALAGHGIDCIVLDREATPPRAAFGRLGGLYHGVVHRADGAHARWLRAAALLAHRQYANAVDEGLVDGQTTGLLRGADKATVETMRATIDHLALPADWVEAFTAEQVSARTGLRSTGPAWHFPMAGWVDPLALRAHWLAREGITLRVGVTVQRVQRRGDRWQLFDADERLLHETDLVVLANAADATRLLGSAPGPWQRTRGQVSVWRGPHPALPVPIADGGYVLQLKQGGLLFGATAQPDDDEPTARVDDHQHNLATLHRLTGWCPPQANPSALEGLVGWRMQTADRLPWVGPVPVREPGFGHRQDQARFIERQSGLYVLAGLGSRGLTHAPLAGELLAAWITGAPVPAPSSLVDALDVARFAARARRVSRN